MKKIAEDSKIAIRNIRRDAIDSMKKLEKDKEISEDDLKRAEKDIQDTETYEQVTFAIQAFRGNLADKKTWEEIPI